MSFCEGHFDQYKPDYLENRVRTARKHIWQLHEGLMIDTAVIFEVGSGAGSVTKVLKEIFPQVNILAVDKDSRAQPYAVANQVEFLLMDVLENSRVLEGLIVGHQVVYINALRTSTVVVERLISITDNCGCLLIASLIRESEPPDNFDAITSEVRQQGQVIYLEQRRGFNEYGYIFDKRGSR